MLELFCNIPENIGWAIVGALSAFQLTLMWKLVKLFFQMWVEWREDREDDEE